MLPEVVVTEYQWKGEDFHIFGPRGGHWAPEHYFDGPVLPGNAIKLESSDMGRSRFWEQERRIVRPFNATKSENPSR